MPLTASKPKALVEIAGKPMLQIAIENLIKYGFNRIVVNVHHFAPMVVQYIKEHKFDAEVLISDESQLLMDTGGAIVKARNFLDVGEPFLVHNVDILSGINLAQMYHAHVQSKALATLAVSQRESSRVFLFDKEMSLCGWKNSATGDIVVSRGNINSLDEYAFSGIHVISSDIYSRVSNTQPFSIVKEYLNLCRTNRIVGISYPDSFVLDMGKPERIKQAEKLLM